MVMDRCCCGCNLKTGTILIGIYHLIMYIPALYIVIHYGGDEEFRQEVYRVSSSDDDDRMNKEDMERIGEGEQLEIFYWKHCTCQKSHIKRDHGVDEWNRDFTYKGRIVDVIGGCLVGQLLLVIVTCLTILVYIAFLTSVSKELIAILTVKYIFAEGYFMWALYHYHQEIKKESLVSVADTSNDKPLDEYENKAEHEDDAV